MKVIRTTKGQYACIPDSVINDIPKKQIEAIFNTIPKEAKPSRKELNIIKNINNKVEHLHEYSKKYTEVIRPALCYKNWTCIAEEYYLEHEMSEFRNSFLAFDVDIDYELTAIFIIDFTNDRIIIELQQSGIALTEYIKDLDEIDESIEILNDFIYNAEEYVDYK